MRLIAACAILALTSAGCGIFDDLPGNHSSTLEREAGLSEEYAEASGSVELHFADGEIHVNLSEMPELAEGCSIVAYATTDEGTTQIGMVMMEEEGEEMGMLKLQEEEEHHHFAGELEADAHDLDIHLHEVTRVECFLECEGSTTKIFSVDLAGGGGEATEGEEAGHAH